MSERQKAPVIGTIPRDWSWSYFGDICKWSRYGVTATSDEDGQYPMLRMNNLQDGKIDTRNLVYIDLSEEEFETHCLNVGELLVNRTNSYELVGKTALVEHHADFVCASYIVRFGLNDSTVDPKFINYFFNSFIGQNHLRVLATKGVSQANINPTTLKEYFVVPLPPLPEQSKIAQILSTWDEAITLVDALTTALKERKQGFMQRLLIGEIRFPGFEDKWEEAQLGHFLKNVSRKVEKPETRYKRLGLRSHGKGTFTEIVEDPDANSMDFLYQVKTDDLIVNITFAWEQAIAIVSKEDDGAYVSHRFPTYEFDREKVISEFFRYLMLTKQFLYELVNISPGGAGRNRVMSKTDFLKLKVQVPKIDEQEKIGTLLMTTDEYISTFQNYAHQLREQKKGLMQRLLMGEVRVKVEE